MNPKPTYFISGRTSGYTQRKNTATPDKTLHHLIEYSDDQQEIYLEQVLLDGNRIPARHHMVIESRTAGANIEISTYDCHLRAVVNGKRFILAPTPHQTLILKTKDGGTKISVADDVQIPLIILAGAGRNTIKTGGGVTEVFTESNTIDITVGTGLTFINSASADLILTGHVLIGNPHGSGLYARGKPGDERFQAPLAAPLDSLASATFEIKGSISFTQAVNNHLTFLRHTACGQRLLTQLARRSWIRISETRTATRFEVHVSDPTENDHYLQQNERMQWVSGWPAEGGDLALNLARSDSENLPLLDFYRCLCEAYNAFKGTTVPGSQTIETFDYREVQVNAAQLQAIGLETGVFYDFDNDPATPPTDTNPSPFTENALRLELGLPPRLYY
ncbi:M91 family zinc metallopeptidase [Pseudomonas monteilii]|uniref:M91 family zinc metallopeptidase n=1 Tax=Pseudomonas monteilii TaxID=76759 RepID=UPI001CBB71AD|nr:M91 family zinc metallopeptidase [Pseudomonas monteilii]MBZ3662276.1 hypothetical protein [Pseudomonas monteilii]MBZ3667602.1 hypothetical protein [Pseudomonas monteilii]